MSDQVREAEERLRAVAKDWSVYNSVVFHTGAMATSDDITTVLDALSELRADAERMDFLGTHLAGSKWADELSWCRPRDASGEYTEKYITGPTMLREAIDAARASGEGAE